MRPKDGPVYPHKSKKGGKMALQFWEWTYATVLIENDWAENHTGFLVGRKVSDIGEYRIFLVSNKHALPATETTPREDASEVTLHCNVRGSDNVTVGTTMALPLHLDDGSRIWRDHPDRDVDVMVFDVTHLIVSNDRMQWRFATYADFADRDKIEELDITIAEEILVVGYPSGLTQGTTNFPLVRSGIVATRIGEPFADEVEEDGVLRRRTVRGFLIDGAVIPGSSGSPVILKPAFGRVVKGTMHANVRTPALLLGVVAETRYAPVKTRTQEIVAFAGLGLAFDAETIKETIERFLQ